jgi:hypothetical protein
MGTTSGGRINIAELPDVVVDAPSLLDFEQSLWKVCVESIREGEERDSPLNQTNRLSQGGDSQ